MLSTFRKVPLSRINEVARVSAAVDLNRCRCAYLSTKQSPQVDTTAEVSNRIPAESLRTNWGSTAIPSFDVGKMKHVLDHDNHEMRNEFREFMKKPLFSC